MAGGAGGNQPDPDEIERRLRELNKEIGRPPVHEPSSLERLVAAKKAEKKGQRKRDTGVLTALRGGKPAAFERLLTQQPPSSSPPWSRCTAG
jgi:hypothetical protein